LLIYAHNIKYVDSTKASLLLVWFLAQVCYSGQREWGSGAENLGREWAWVQRPGTGTWNPWKLLGRVFKLLVCRFV